MLTRQDMMTLGTATQLRSVAGVTTVDVAGSPLRVKAEMMSLGVIIDSHLTLRQARRSRRQGV